jgi:transcriptional regulator with XRE-family HTH domain
LLARDYRGVMPPCQELFRETCPPGRMGNKIPPPPGFGERLRRALKESGLTEASLAEKVGADNSTVNRWLSEERFPSWGKLMRVAQEIHCTTDYLLGMPKAEGPPPRQVNPAVVEAVRLLAERIDGAGDAAAAVAAALALPPPKKKRT